MGNTIAEKYFDKNLPLNDRIGQILQEICKKTGFKSIGTIFNCLCLS